MINFSTDYHLGQSLNTHTTHESRGKLKQALYHQALSVTEDQNQPHYCLGDMTHTYRNSEDVIQQAISILGRLTNCIMGNHDVTNRTDSLGTLELLEPLYEVVPAIMGKCTPLICNEDDAVLTLVPHTNSQELFIETLEFLAEKPTQEKPELLLLHCNYESPWDNNETTLNLTEDVAKKLLKRFDYVLIGHEHNYREELNGKVILLGNIHPTNFGDISDKYRWSYSEGRVQKHLVWEKSKHFKTVQAFTEDSIGAGCQFLEVTGNVPAADYPSYCKWLAGFWKNFKGFAIRSNVEVTRENFTSTVDEASLQNLQQTIAGELEEDPELKKLFKELLEEIK